jgi:PilZ domain
MSDRPSRDFGPGLRKSLRRSFHYSVRAIGPNGLQWDGFVINISETGAKLEFIDTRDIPNEFVMLIGGHAGVKRRCQVVWCKGDRLGVKFVQSP